MSHGHDVYHNSEARWFSAFAAESDFTRMVYAFAMSQDDAKQAMAEAFGPIGNVTLSDGPRDRMPFVVTEAAQTTRQISTKGIGVHL